MFSNRAGLKISNAKKSKSASVFVVQYEGEVKESVYKQMEELAKAKAIFGQRVFWSVIDDDGTKRLRRAYPNAFGR